MAMTEQAKQRLMQAKQKLGMNRTILGLTKITYS